MIALGSGEPARTHCSKLIAQAIRSIRYPILPVVMVEADTDPHCLGCRREIRHVRSLFAPPDFDISPCFPIL